MGRVFLPQESSVTNPLRDGDFLIHDGEVLEVSSTAPHYTPIYGDLADEVRKSAKLYHAAALAMADTRSGITDDEYSEALEIEEYSIYQQDMAGFSRGGL